MQALANSTSTESNYTISDISRLGILYQIFKNMNSFEKLMLFIYYAFQIFYLLSLYMYHRSEGGMILRFKNPFQFRIRFCPTKIPISFPAKADFDLNFRFGPVKDILFLSSSRTCKNANFTLKNFSIVIFSSFMLQRNPADPDDRDQNVGQIRCEGEELVSILDDARGTQSM